MTYPHSSPKHKKGGHLSAIERGKIAGWLAEKLSNCEIARRISVHHTTIANELERGQVKQIRKINGIKYIYVTYNPEYTQSSYETKRQKCHRPTKFNQVKAFLAYFVERFQTVAFAPDVAVGVTKSTGLFHLSEMVSTTTLYKYIDEQRLEIRNIDFLHKLGRKNNQKRTLMNKKILGKSIESPPEHVESREEFGHFEIDTVIDKRKGTETALLMLY
ncbi:hypothetical protein A5888_003117 [Enterococcus sp. 9E7_DIV0242]|uniref:Transposase IS30-like HTH domain-containing protein n=1 Tax=Candidatus Enterococcus clewellii TaxID=1834193 RepID=A0A242K0C4_9ENTE|nr:IS30 family transposase [Enterococcus sp. 9E7_DIV0242]OTP10633.1 hypothetical protein A5888_003931 [Enterococcus sp. 9E7_DIV0242]